VRAFDTNVLVYATDSSAGAKHARSTALLAAALTRQDLLIPTQVLAEYYGVVTRKLKLRPEAARGNVETWAQAALAVVAYDLADLRAAMEASAKHDIAAWDALVWAVCERAGVRTLVTEDFQDGRTLGRVTFLDPFNPANAARLGLDG
jgi:predicted nucleic acid-binding protein